MHDGESRNSWGIDFEREGGEDEVRRDGARAASNGVIYDSVAALYLPRFNGPSILRFAGIQTARLHSRSRIRTASLHSVPSSFEFLFREEAAVSRRRFDPEYCTYGALTESTRWFYRLIVIELCK